jgi:hypothetical protein
MHPVFFEGLHVIFSMAVVVYIDTIYIDKSILSLSALFSSFVDVQHPRHLEGAFRRQEFGFSLKHFLGCHSLGFVVW